MAGNEQLTVGEIREARAEAEAEIARALEAFTDRLGFVPQVEILHDLRPDGTARYQVTLHVTID